MNFNTISVLMPTRGRVRKLQRALDSLRKNAEKPSSIEVVFRIDLDDDETQKLLQDRQELFIVGPREKGYASLPKFMNQCAGISSGDIIIMFNDDAVVETKGWDSKLLKCANDFPDGIFNIGVDTGLNANLFPFSIISRHIYHILGFINDERLIFSDIFLLDVMKSFNRAILLPTVKMTHEWAGFDSLDQTRKEAHILENKLVFDGSPGDASEPKRNWRPSYRRIHEIAVREAIEKIRRYQQKSSYQFKSDSPLSKNINGFHSVCTEDSGFLQLLKKQYIPEPFFNLISYLESGQILKNDFLLLPVPDMSLLEIWGKFFSGGIGLKNEKDLCNFSYENHSNVRLYKGPLSSTSFLMQFKDHCLDFKSDLFSREKTLIIEDDFYPISIAVYYIFKKILIPGSVIIFVHRSEDERFSFSNKNLVENLETGVVDGQKHLFEHFQDPWTRQGFSLELLY